LSCARPSRWAAGNFFPATAHPHGQKEFCSGRISALAHISRDPSAQIRRRKKIHGMSRATSVQMLQTLWWLAFASALLPTKFELVEASGGVFTRLLVFVFNASDAYVVAGGVWSAIAALHREMVRDFARTRRRLGWWVARWLVTLACTVAYECWSGAIREFPVGTLAMIASGIVYGCVPADAHDLPGGSVCDGQRRDYDDNDGLWADSDFVRTDDVPHRARFVPQLRSVSYAEYRWRHLVAFGAREWRRRREPAWQFSEIALDARSADFLRPRCADAVVAIASDPGGGGVRNRSKGGAKHRVLRAVIRDPDLDARQYAEHTMPTNAFERITVDTGGPTRRALRAVAETLAGRSNAQIIDGASVNLAVEYRDHSAYVHASGLGAPRDGALPLFVAAAAAADGDSDVRASCDDTDAHYTLASTATTTATTARVEPKQTARRRARHEPDSRRARRSRYQRQVQVSIFGVPSGSVVAVAGDVGRRGACLRHLAHDTDAARRSVVDARLPTRVGPRRRRE
jgi:hypothetical protein